MTHKFFSLLLALLASMTIFAMGNNSGSSQEDAIEYDWENGNIHYGDSETESKWYRLDLAPLYEGADTLRLSITNLSNTESVNVFGEVIEFGAIEEQTLSPQSIFAAWEINPEFLVRELHLQELFFVVSSTGKVQLTWQVIRPTGDSCEDAQHFCHQEAGTKWHAIYAPYVIDGDVIDSLVIRFDNTEGDNENNISVSFKTSCEVPAFDARTFTIEPYGEKNIVFPAESLAALGWPDIVFSCASSSPCCVDHLYYASTPGNWCDTPKDLAWDTIEHLVVWDEDRWYRLQLDETTIPEDSDIRLHFANTSAEINNIAADIYFDCNDPYHISNNYQLAPNEDTHIDIHREALNMLGWPTILLDYTSTKTSRIWAEMRPLYRDTIWEEEMPYFLCKGNTFVTYQDKESIIWNDTLLHDTWTILSVNNGLTIMDSIITYHIYTLKLPEVLSINQMQTMGAAPSLVQGKPLDVATSNALLTQYYRKFAYTDEKYAFVDTVYWAKPVYKADGSLDVNKEASLDLTSPYTSSDFEDTLLLVIISECEITRVEYFFPVEGGETPCVIASGTCGENLTWELNCDGELIISGTGEMDNNSPWYSYKASITSVIISNGVTSIGESAFYGCRGLTAIEIPNSVISIGESVFYGCRSLTSINVAEDNPQYCSVDGVLFNKDKTTLIQYPASKTATSYVVPNSVTSIEEWAFWNCNGLTSIKLPIGLTSIGGGAFFGCNGLTSIEIPISVTSIEASAFYACSSLTSVINNAIVPQTVNANIFSGIDLSTATLYVPVESLEAYQNADVWKDFGSILPIDSSPSDEILTQYYTPGEVCVCIYVPKEIACNDIVLTGSFNGWTDIPANCVRFEPVVGYDGWYVTSYTPEAQPDTYNGLQAKPVMLDKYGNFNWEYQVGAATKVRGGVQIVQSSFAGEIDLINYSIDAPNVYKIDEWKQTPCDIVYHDYHIEVISDGCDGLVVPYIIGEMNNWHFETMEFDVNKSNSIGAPVYYYDKNMSENTPYQILSGLMDSEGKIVEEPTWNMDSYMQKLINGEWVRYPGDDGINLLTKEETNIVFDLRADNIRWARCVTGETPCSTITGTCGNNLTWELTCDSVLTISGTGAIWRLTEEQAWRPYKEQIKTAILPEGLDSIAPNAFYQCVNLASVNLPNSVRAVGNKAFVDCDKLSGPVYNDRIFAYMPGNYSGTSYFVPEGIVSIAAYAFSPNCYAIGEIVLPSSLKRMGISALGGAFRLQKLTCYATTPPECAEGAFSCLLENEGVVVSIDKSIPVYVPAESVEAYKIADQWKDFSNILPITAQETETTDVTVATTDNTATVAWPSVSGAYTYELVIKDKDGNVICTLVFNAQGQLTQIVFGAPAHGKAPQQAQSAGFSFTVTGLNEGTSYDLTLTAKDESGNELDKKNVSFHTEGPQGIEDIHMDIPQATKILLDGQIYILRGDKVYNAQGALVK